MRPASGDRRPTYSRIAEILRCGLRTGSVPSGTVLLEAPLSRLFQSSRSPVKQALAELEVEGLVRRFDGRGYVVGEGAPSRIEVTATMLGLSPSQLGTLHERTADALYYGVERELILHSLVGAFRVNELALSRHLDVGRTVAHDILLRARAAGVLDKGDNSRWTVVPLDRARIDHFYEVRLLLEPVALRKAADRIPTDLLGGIELRHRDAADHWPETEAGTLDRLEEDLHVICLGYGPNPEIVEALRRSRTVMLSGKHVQRALGPTADADRFVDDHLAVIAALRDGHAEEAGARLAAHLATSRDKAFSRLDAFLRAGLPASPTYIDV